jgi:hypothetical protein
MYVWHEFRNAIPLDLSPSNSGGAAGRTERVFKGWEGDGSTGTGRVVLAVLCWDSRVKAAMICSILAEFTASLACRSAIA